MIWLLVMMRHYREEGLLDKWVAACRNVEKAKTILSPERKARFHYERALSALFALNLPDLKTRLAEWPDNDSLSFLNVKKAGLLAEIGQMGEARSILEHALEKIRSGLKLTPTPTNYSLVSQESFVMFLLHCAQPWPFTSDDQQRRQQELRKQFFERWHELRQYKCDPWNERAVFEGALERPPVDRSNVTIRPTFDIGRRVQTRHFGNWDNEALAAYKFLRFCEDVGLPFRMPEQSIATKSAAGTLSRIANYSPSWAMATLVRINDEKAVDHIFNRVSLAGMDVASVDSLAARYLEALELAVPDIETGDRFRDVNFGIVLASVVPEILSRLCCRCSQGVKTRLVDFLIGVYQSEQRGNYRGIHELTKRLLESLSVFQRIDSIPQLLAFPILTNPDVIDEQHYVNPFVFLDLDRDAVSVQPTIADETLDQFIEQASSDNPRGRKWALLTLGRLYDLGLLGAKSTEQFAKALWGRLDNDGLPSDTNFYRHKFLTLPHPTAVEPVALFKKYVKRTQFPLQGSATGIEIGIRESAPLCVDICRASKALKWSDDEAYPIVHRLVEWWDADKKHSKRVDDAGSLGSIADHFRQRFADFVSTLVAMIAPGFKPTDGSTMRETLQRVTRELSDYAVPALRLEIACLHIFPKWRDQVLQRVEDAMASSAKDVVIDALRAVWIVSERIGADGEGAGKEDLVRLLREVSQIVRWRREKGLSLAIGAVADVTKRHPWTFVGDIEGSVLLGLQFMIGDTAVHACGGLRLDTAGDGLDVATKLEVRCAAARLAYTLSEHYANRDEAVPDAIGKWQAICQSDNEFAEIRNRWA